MNSINDSDKLVQIILNSITSNNWNGINVIFSFTQSGSIGWEAILDNNPIYLDPFDLSPALKGFRAAFNQVKEDSALHFNKITLSIKSDRSYHITSWWDDEEVKKDKLAWSNVLPQWLNDRLLSVIYQAGYDDKINWQRGEFTFTIQQSKLNFDGIIYDGQTPVPIDIRLPNFVVEGVLDHYQITNEGILKDQWQPWNQLIIRSPNNSLDLDKDVTYRLVADKV